MRARPAEPTVDLRPRLDRQAAVDRTAFDRVGVGAQSLALRPRFGLTLQTRDPLSLLTPPSLGFNSSPFCLLPFSMPALNSRVFCPLRIRDEDHADEHRIELLFERLPFDVHPCSSESTAGRLLEAHFEQAAGPVVPLRAPRPAVLTQIFLIFWGGDMLRPRRSFDEAELNRLTQDADVCPLIAPLPQLDGPASRLNGSRQGVHDPKAPRDVVLRDSDVEAALRPRSADTARVTDLTTPMIQAWMDDMAGVDLALSTIRVRQSVLSSFCGWLVKRDLLVANPVAKLERPPHHREPPKQVPGSEIMDALVEAAKARRRPRDVAIFLIMRYTGMRRESVATLRVQHLDRTWGLRGVRDKGGKTRDIPLPSVVAKFLQAYVEMVLVKQVEKVGPETPLFWSTWGRRAIGKTRAPMTGKNIWRLCKVYGRMIGYPELKPHDLRHGVAMEVLEQHHDLEQVRALLGHSRIDTTQVYASIRPAQLKRAVSFYEEKAIRILTE